MVMNPPKVALVTGGARRVGRAIALALAQAGCDIGLHFRTSRDDAERTASDVRKLGRRCALVEADLLDETTCPQTIEQTITALGRLDALVNNASMFDSRHPTERATTGAGFEAGEWDRMFRINATAAAGLCHFARPHLEASGQGRIVNLCDIAAEHPWPGYLSYCCSKAALVALTRGLARAYAPRITVNGVSPGIAMFPDEYPPDLRSKLISQVPLQRAGTPEEVAGLVRYLVESGDYITGQIIAIDGGRSLS
jgi:pteridine reductase